MYERVDVITILLNKEEQRKVDSLAMVTRSPTTLNSCHGGRGICRGSSGALLAKPY